MAPMFQVQTGIPLPLINRAAKEPRRKYPLETMAVGAMFFVPGMGTKSFSAYISRTTKDIAGKYAARHVWMVQRPDGTWWLSNEHAVGAVEGTGVWRTE